MDVKSSSKPEGCSSDCSSCSQDCSQRNLRLESGAFSNIKKVIGIVSGKGGVGKSLVTSVLASEMQSRGFACGILDADVTGPSIPKAFGISKNAAGDERGLLPCESRMGIKIMSVNLLLEKTDAPVVWRGPVISNVIRQFWTDVAWGSLDYLFVDMPPGTGDVSLTVFQSLPLDGIIIVTTPQDLVSLIVKKAFNMAKIMKVPVLGLVENMSYFVCPSCEEKHSILGKSRVDEFAAELGVPALDKIPMMIGAATLVDDGAAELIDSRVIKNTADFLENSQHINK